MKLDLGCGKNKKDGFIGVDSSIDSDADIVWDLRGAPWQLGDELMKAAVGESEFKFAARVRSGIYRAVIPDQSVEEVWSSHFFEHLSGPERMPFMNELWRVMNPGAKATIITPFWTSHRSVQDPTHAWPPVCEQTYLYFNKKWREDSKLDHYPIHADFDFTIGYGIDQEVAVRAEEYQRFAVKYYNNSVPDLHVVLTRRE